MGEREIEAIEAVLRQHIRLNGRERSDEPYYSLIGFSEAAQAIAALRAQDREDGAREMRERAAKAADDWLTIWGTREIRHTSAREYASGAVADVLDAIRVLPLSPARKEDGA